MHKVQHSVLVSYSAEQMFNLVADVERYPVFMPWCGGSEVICRDEQSIEAGVTISLAGIKQRFATRNTHHFPERIDLELVDGPFSALIGHWVFKSLDANACKIIFTLEYAFSNRTLETLLGPIFNHIASSFIGSFTRRADELYSPL